MVATLSKDSTPRGRREGPTVALQRRLALVLLLCQGGITVSGSLVRVTGSGLGCSQWPLCNADSLVPVAGAAPLVHQAIEFGNRLLTFVVSAAAIAVVIAAHRAGRRREIKALAWASIGGVVLQAIIGGISVLVDLRWWAVAVHFLPSMALVWVAALLYMRIAEPDEAPLIVRFAPAARRLAALAAAALCVVLVTGTMVTGSGPHSGDATVGMEGRLALDTEMLAYVHAACMYAYLIATLCTVYLLRRSHAPADAFSTAVVLVAMIIIQWGIGVAQFYLGVPRWTVPMHIAMSSVVVAATAFLWAHGRRRLP
ncbi:COX15/CtaA family protein [Corynebacterium liangguodongii]|uniref:Cytochrome B n=1 Tax=Corynebacterium liangguodongii TaxID=2079535 RepID=A0A2S0WE52_9CORY|nr:COX15/CtaA family protein [Corynebacterium liangguodongii]AWB84048.1 cytochrome B [Corynebacterium liangguodongii]PWC00059.1 heme A synthase [Corynebacterium liangguodongii]